MVSSDHDQRGNCTFFIQPGIYGSEAILPVEFGIPSPRMTYEFERKEEEKHVNLDLLP